MFFELGDMHDDLDALTIITEALCEKFGSAALSIAVRQQNAAADAQEAIWAEVVRRIAIR